MLDALRRIWIPLPMLVKAGILVVGALLVVWLGYKGVTGLSGSVRAHWAAHDEAVRVEERAKGEAVIQQLRKDKAVLGALVEEKDKLLVGVRKDIQVVDDRMDERAKEFTREMDALDTTDLTDEQLADVVRAGLQTPR